MGFTTDVTRGAIIRYNNEPWVIVDKEFYSPAKGAAFNKTKLKNIKTGKIVAQTFRSGEKLEELDTETKTMQFLYFDERDAYFMDPVSFDQVNIKLDEIPGEKNYLHTDGKYIMLIYEGEVISVQMPQKLSLIVTETGEGAKGNTATGAMKEATVETGLVINVPLFIKQGDKIVVSTESNTYFSKVN